VSVVARRAALVLAAASAVACGGGQRADRGADSGATTRAESADTRPAVATADSAATPPDTGRASDPAATQSERGQPDTARAAPVTGGAPRGSATGAKAAGAADTVRGTAAVVGAEPRPRVVVRPTSGGSVTIIGSGASALGRVSGAEVVARGVRRDAGTLELSSFSVRSVDGVPAVDGRLTQSGDRLVLVGADGARRPIVNPPAALRAHVGARVWVSGAPDQEPQAFGVIEPRR